MAYMMGIMVLGVMSIVFGLIHLSILTAFGLEANLVAWGILLGFVHWLMVGMALGMMPMMHQFIKSGEMDRPGVFALKFPPMTAMGFFMFHLLFGALVGAFYEVFI